MEIYEHKIKLAINKWEFVGSNFAVFVVELKYTI